MVAPTLPFTGLQSFAVFAVEDTVAQLVWRGLGPGTVGVVVDGSDHRTIGETGRLGAADVTGLRPASSHVIDITVDGRPIGRVMVDTEPALDGPALARIATVSDLHLGETGFGLFKEMRETPRAGDDYPLRCARAAVNEAVDWGAELLVIKGDITEDGQPGDWELFDALLDEVSIPVIAVPGNHDTFGRRRALDATAELQRRGLFDRPVQRQTVGGVEILVPDTTVATHSWGRLGHHTDELCHAVGGPRPALLFMHHHIQARPVPAFWPLGTPRDDGMRTIDALLDVTPDLVVSSGHTHRNRVRRHGRAVLSEVGATKDHPGGWAGYVLHSSGVRQVVRRVAEPSCLEWNDRTHAAVGGIWGRWSPGSMADRSFTHRWSTAAATFDPTAAAQTSEAPSESR